MTYYWDEFVGRYRDEKGRFVSKETVYEWVNKSLQISTNVAESLAGFVYNGNITVNDWLTSMRTEIKDEYIRQYLSFIGGRDAMTQADWGRIGGMLTEQYKYLDNFAKDIASGNLTEAQINARSQMYINSARESRERARSEAAKKADFDEAFWEVNPHLENCPDCEEFTMAGWVAADNAPWGTAYPGSGDTKCLTACGCTLSYRNSETGKEYQM